MGGSRADVVSSFTVIKGSLLDETYEAFRVWDFDLDSTVNLRKIRDDNLVHAKSSHWLRDVTWVIRRRFDPGRRDRALVELAKMNCDHDVWKAALLWHMTRDEFLVRDFLIHWLYPRYIEGVFRMHADDVIPYLIGLRKKRAIEWSGQWTESTTSRVATGLLRIAADFGLVKGTARKEFAHYNLPEESFLYILHAMSEDIPSAQRILQSEDWKMFLMGYDDVERELLRLHQFRKLHYEAAGSLIRAQVVARFFDRLRKESRNVTDWKKRLTKELEPLLLEPDPRPGISAYHDMPYAIFHYPPDVEFALRQELSMLRTRIEQSGKRVTTISLAERLDEALKREDFAGEALAKAEREVGLLVTIETIHEIISQYQPLDDLVAEEIPEDATPTHDVIFIVRVGALFPVYRTSALLEQLKGKVHVPAVLFYPGELDGAAGLRFMGVLDAEHNYRPKIF